MNRITIILLALVIIVAHSLAIHQTGNGAFAAPYEIAHVAFRAARNLVYLGSSAWNPGGDLIESYPSPVWVLICAAAERVYLRSGLFAQCLGVAFMLGTVGVLTQFSSKRMSGLVAPVLLAASGSAAAAGLSGTEAPLVMLLLTTAFLAFERGWMRLFIAVAALLVFTRPEGIWLVLGFLVLHSIARSRTDAKGARRTALSVFAVPLACFVLLTLVRRLWLGTWLSPMDADIFAADPGQWSLGYGYLEGFLLCSGSGPLIVLPIAALLLGASSGTGRRALFLTALWSALVVTSGGDDVPLWNAMAPVLPLFFLSIQESITVLLDRWARLAAVAWSILLVGVAASFLVSKTPGNIGPLPLEQVLSTWMAPRDDRNAASDRPLGRQGLAMEIREVERLRALSAFLREKLAQPATILTPWPGAVGCISRKRTYDLLGRTTLAPGMDRPNSWRGTPRLDIVQAFDEEPDYVVPVIENLAPGQAPIEIVKEWLRRYDVVGDEQERLVELLKVLARYELVCVPVVDEESGPTKATTSPFLLLRRRTLQLAPELEIEESDGRYHVLVHHGGHHQVVDLRVWVEDAEGKEWSMRPTGEFEPDDVLRARTGLLLYATGSRPTRLVEVVPPAGLEAVRLTALLYNPRATTDSPLSHVGTAKSIDL